MADAAPNVVFLLTDDQRFDTIAALGNPAIHTPNMDRLAARGCAFTHAHIPGGTSPAVCMPSRAMIHTGRTLYHLDGAGQAIPADHVMLGETFRAAGYQTFGTGKWHNGKQAYHRSFTDGAEIFFGGMTDHWNVPAYDFDPTGRYDGSLPVCSDPFRGNRVDHRQADHIHAGRHSSELFADATIDFLHRRDAHRPFFAYVSFLAPHDPRTMPAEYLAMYDPDEIDLPPNFLAGHPFDNGELHIRDEMLAGFPRTPEEVRRHIAEYHAMITHLDAQIGRILDDLDQAGLTDNTIVVLAGDNGLALGQHGLMGKQNLYDHSVRVPLIFAGPGVSQGVTTPALAYLLDIYPTLCDLAGLPTPASVEGLSLTPAIADPAATVRDALYLGYMGLQRGVTDGRRKLIEYVVPDRDRHTQLFDLLEDPWEMRNLAGLPEHAQTQRALSQTLRRMRDAWDDHQEAWGGAFHAGLEG